VSMDGTVARLKYKLHGDRLHLLHTEVPEAFRGQGVGGRLVEAALAKARADHLTDRALVPLRAQLAEGAPRPNQQRQLGLQSETFQEVGIPRAGNCSQSCAFDALGNLLEGVRLNREMQPRNQHHRRG